MRIFPTSDGFSQMVSHWSLSDIKSPQVSRTLLGILNNAVVWMVSTRPIISKSFSPCTNPLVTVLRANSTIRQVLFFLFNNQQKKRTCRIVDFAVPADH